MPVPHLSIGRIPDVADALPSLWNNTYEKIDANFGNLDTRLGSRESEITAARGTASSLAARLLSLQEDVEGLNPDMQNAIVAVLMEAVSSAGLANREHVKTLSKRFQTGVATIQHRGVVKGCTVGKSSTATRNVSMAAGIAFAAGQLLPIQEELNGAAIPSNPGGASATCYLYLGRNLSGSDWEMFCTGLGSEVPSSGIPLYRATVPAGNTEIVDPYLSAVSLTDIRRLEPGAPAVFTSAPFVYVPLPHSMIDGEYSVCVDILDFEGGGFQLGYVYAADRQSNGFKLCLNGSADSVRVRWTARKIML